MQDHCDGRSCDQPSRQAVSPAYAVHGKEEEIILQLKTGEGDRRFRIGGSSLENIYNYAEFDVLLTSPLCIAPDRAFILRGIHEAIVKGASCLQETLQTYVSVPPMTIVSSTLSNESSISNISTEKSTEKEIKLPYRKLFQIHDEEKKGTLYCMLSSRPTLKSFSYFTQVTMGIPFPHVLTVLRLITKELLDHKDTNGLRHPRPRERWRMSCREAIPCTILRCWWCTG